MAVLRNVSKTFSFEEQRIEINEIAQDLFDLHSAPAVLFVTNGAPFGNGNVVYDNSNGELTFTPPDLSDFLEVSITTPTTGQVIKYNGTNWVNSTDDGIALTDLSITINPNAWQDGLLEYDNTNGVFTYTPPDLSVYLQSVGSIDSHTDVSTTGSDAPSQFDTLIWDGIKWKPGLVGNVPLTQFSVTTSNVNGGGALSYDQSSGVFTFSPTDLSGIFSGDYNDLTNKPAIPAAQIPSDWTQTDNTSPDYIRNKPTLSTVAGTGDYNDLINKPAIPTDNSQLTNGAGYITGIGSFSLGSLLDVNTTGVGNGQILKYNGVSWEIGDDEEGTTITSLSDIGDVTITTTPNSGDVLKWNGIAWVPGTDQTGSGSTNTQDIIVPIAFAKIDDNNAGTGVNISWGAYNTGTYEIDFTFTTAQPDTDYYVHTNREHYATHNIEVYSKTTTGFTTKWTNSDGSDLSPDTFGGALVVYASDPTTSVAGQGGGSGGIALTDLSVTTNTAANPSSLAYDSGTGIFTYTPPDISNAGVDLTAFSVTTNAASGGGALSYDNTNGQFAYTPPSIPAAQVQSDWNATSGLGEILNKPNLATVATTGSYNDLSDTPSIPSAQIQSDWSVTDSSHTAYIQNKPTIPAAQIQADWNESDSNHTAFIKNKPTIGAIPSVLSDLTDVDSTAPSTGHVLKWDGTNWAPDSIGGSGNTGNDSVAVGSICMWSGSIQSIPTGWSLCDGSNGTPDLREKFIIGASLTDGGIPKTDITGSHTQTGGSKDATLVSHNHGGSTGNDGDHGHGNTGSGGSHSHNIHGGGSHNHGGNTSNQSNNHYHSGNTSNAGNHNHRWGTDDNIGAHGGTNNPDANGGTAWKAWTDTQGDHSHYFDTGGISQDHNHSINTESSHGHGMDSAGSHTHSISNAGSHSHTISEQGDTSTNANLPPYFALAYIMKTTASGASFALSVTTETASGGGALEYNNTSGIFTYTPPDLSAFASVNHTHSFSLQDVCMVNSTTDQNITTSGTLSDAGGNVRSLPVNLQSTSYELTASDSGKLVKANGDITISNTSAFGVGNMISVYNTSNSDINITRSNTTLYMSGDSADQDRVLATKGVCTILCVGSNEYVITGSVS